MHNLKSRKEKHSGKENITRHRGCVNFPPSPRALSLILFYFLRAGRLLFFSSVTVSPAGTAPFGSQGM